MTNERVRDVGVRLSRHLDFGLLELFFFVVPRLFPPIAWALSRIGSLAGVLVRQIRKLSSHLLRLVTRAAALVTAAIKAGVLGIWRNGPLSFCCSCSVLFVLYKVNSGDWVLVSDPHKLLIAGVRAYLRQELLADLSAVPAGLRLGVFAHASVRAASACFQGLGFGVWGLGLGFGV
jgi:hypothetical protein